MIVFVALLLCAGCEAKRPPTPTPGPGTGESISGRERIGWDQPAADASDLATFRYAIYVDNVRSEMAEVSCAGTSGATGFACSGRLPTMSPGAHTLELAAFLASDAALESPKSAPLLVTVTGATAPAGTSPLVAGERFTTTDGVELEVQRVASDLLDPSDIAVAPDGRVFVLERSGRVLIVTAEGATPALTIREAADSGGALSLALSPGFQKTPHVFILHTVPAAEGLAFRTSRYTEMRGHLVQRMVLLPDVSASTTPSAALRFGADDKLYAAFDDGDRPGAAASLSDWRGKVLRLEPDGRTPVDQPAASPVFWTDVASPHALAWMPGGETVWMAEESADGVERLRAMSASGVGTRRASQRAVYVLPQQTGAASLMFYQHGVVPQFSNDLFIAARTAGAILRVRFDGNDRSRAVTTERLLDGRIGAVRALGMSGDGGIYFCTADALWRISVAR